MNGINDNKCGLVVIAGAGPGDPELLTLKALRYLQLADVVVVDRLVSLAALEEFIRDNALIIPVGKQNKNGASTPQQYINECLVQHARSGKLVVRLKGGDVSIFSQIIEELQALREHDIPYEIVPGITAASGAAAYAGIPLTARGYSTAVRFLTWYNQEPLPATYWDELAATSDTLVFYMSSGALDALVEKLVAHAIGSDKWLAVIEQATTPFQHVDAYPIYDHASKDRSKQVSPTLIVVGRVVSLYESFRWKPDCPSGEEWFPELIPGLVADKMVTSDNAPSKL
jgi:uroporphyrin-III C-methyltransferase/precorrin-2 dehydrogenase/sirohydrochlorin ferrochelatase/uroporphyrin-III C-methyltransferase